MRIADVSSLYNTLPQLQKLQQAQETQQEQLVTGRKINRLEDNAAASHSILSSRIDREAIIQARDNAQRATTLTEAGVNSLEYLREIGEQAQKIVNDTSLRGSTAAGQVDQLIKDALSAANTKVGGDYLFGGVASASTPFSTDASGNIVYNGSGDGRSFTVADGASVSPFTGDASNQQIFGFLNTLVSLRDSLAAGDNTGIAAAGSSLQQAEDSLVEASSDLGLKQYRIETLQSRDAIRYSALDDAELRTAAVDTTQTIVELLNTQKAYQSALQSVSAASKLSLLNYL